MAVASDREARSRLAVTNTEQIAIINTVKLLASTQTAHWYDQERQYYFDTQLN